jgi:trigger factor
MNIVKENIDNLNALLKVQIAKDDYDSKVTDVLKDYRRKASIPGFRPGKVPASLINRMYRKPVLVEEINKLVSESINKYIADEKLNILGDPMPSEKQKDVDWDTDADFEFSFELGLAPEIEVKLSAKDKIPYFEIKISKETIDTYIQNVTSRFGEFKPKEEAGEKDILKGSIAELDENGALLENGYAQEEITISLNVVDNQESKKQLIGLKVQSEIDINLKQAFPNENKLSAILKTDKAKLEKMGTSFRFTVHEINSFVNGELNQELFNKMYGEGVINSEEEFRGKIENEITTSHLRDSDYKFKIDSREILVEKIKFDLPLEFLKKWLLYTNHEKMSADDVEKHFPAFQEDLKWQLIRNTILKDTDIKVTEEEVLDFAKKQLIDQYKYYGLSDIPDETVTQYAKDYIAKREEYQKVAENILEDKVFDHIKQIVKLDKKEVSEEEFKALFEKVTE